MGVAGMMTPLNATAYKNLQLNAGLFVVGADALDTSDTQALRDDIKYLMNNYMSSDEGQYTEYSDGKPVSKYDHNCILGVTRGGGSFVVDREMRQAEVDGVRYRFAGDTFVDSVDAQLTTTLLEVFPGNIKRILGAADIEHAARSTKWSISTRTRINKVTDYIRYLWWVGDLSDGRLMAVKFNYAINTAGMSMTFTDKGEATLPVEFHAVQPTVADYDEAPFEIYIIDNPIPVSRITALIDDVDVLSPAFDTDTMTYQVERPEGAGSFLTLTFRLSNEYRAEFRVYKENAEVIVLPSCITNNSMAISLYDGQTPNGVYGLEPPFRVVVYVIGQGDTVFTSYTINVS